MCCCKDTTGPGRGKESPPPEPSGWQPCQVETYSGYRLHEQPRRFTFRDDWLEVRRILARWREPEHLCFTIAASDARRYLLRYQQYRDSWEVLIWSGSEATPA